MLLGKIKAKAYSWRNEERTHVINFSKKLLICLTKPKTASNGCVVQRERMDGEKGLFEKRSNVSTYRMRFVSYHTCNKIQMPAQKPATGQAIKIKRRSQMSEKRTFLAMVESDKRVAKEESVRWLSAKDL